MAKLARLLNVSAGLLSCLTLCAVVMNLVQHPGKFNVAEDQPGFLFDKKLDQSVGASFNEFIQYPSPAFELKGMKPKPTLVFFAGSCDACSLRTVRPQAVDWNKYSSVIAVYRSKEALASEKAARRYPRWKTVLDPSNKLGSKFNAAWYPRFYVFSPTGKLLRQQQYNEPSSAFGVENVKL